MAIPPVEIKVTADTTQAQAGLNKVATSVKDVSKDTLVATKGAKGMSSAMGVLGNVSGQTRAKIQNTSYQLQDIAVQMQMGTRTSVVMAQQLPQLAGAFGAVGAVVGVLAAVGIPAVAFAMSKFRDEAIDLEDSLDDLSRIAEGLSETQSVLKKSALELVEAYGFAADRTREFALSQAELRASFAAARLQEQVSILDDVIDRYTTLATGGRTLRNTLQRIEQDFGTTSAEAEGFMHTLQGFENAGTFEEQQVALRAIFDTLKEMEIPLTAIPEDLQIAIDEMITLGRETELTKKFMSDLSAEAAGITVGTPLFMQNLGDGGLLPPGASGGTSGGGGGGRRSSGGGSGQSEAASRLERLVESLKSEQEVINEWHEIAMTDLENATAAELEALGGKNEAKLRLEEEYQSKLARIKELGQKADLVGVIGAGADILGALGSTSEKALQASKLFAAAEAAVSIGQGMAKELAKGTFGFASAALVATKGAAIISSINSVSSSGGSSSVASTGGTAAVASEPVERRYAEFSFVGGNVLDPRAIVDAMNEAYDEGYLIKGVIS